MCPLHNINPFYSVPIKEEPSLVMSKLENYAIDGRDFQINCKASAPIKKCVFQFEKSTIDVPEGFKDILKFSYVGDGFEKGDCGIEIEGKLNMEGKVTCIVQLRENDQNLTANGKIKLDVNVGRAIFESNSNKLGVFQFNEGQSMQFFCRAQNGKYSKAKLLIGKNIKAPLIIYLL